MIDVKDVIFFTSSNTITELSEFYLGTAIGNDSIVLDKHGFEKYKTERCKNSFLSEGRFIVCEEVEDNLFSVYTDSFGSEAIFIYEATVDGVAVWALSSSLQYLAERVKSFNWPLEVCVSAIATFFIKGSFGKQQLSSQTIYEQIKLLKPGKEVVCDVVKRKFILKDRAFSSNNNNYKDGLLSWFNKWRAVINTLASEVDASNPIVFDITGGIDSRMMMSIALSCQRKDFVFYTQKHKNEDFKVAKSLCEKFNLTLTTEKCKRAHADIDTQYQIWKYGNSGFFMLPQRPAVNLSMSKSIKITGVGGENFRQFYKGKGVDWKAKIKNNLPSSLSGYFLDITKLLESAFIELDVDENTGFSMVKHYRKFRSRIIGGRAFYENLKYRTLSPLFDSDLLDLADKTGVSAKELYRDILLLGGGPELALHFFDDEQKNFDRSFLSLSAFWHDSEPFINISEMPLKDFEIYRSECPIDEENINESAEVNLFSMISTKVNEMLLSDLHILDVDENIKTELIKLAETPIDNANRKTNEIILHSILTAYKTAGI